MSVQCPKCGYTRTPTDRAPDYECPSCGVVYKKYEAFLRRSAEQAETNAAAAETMVLGELQEPENTAEPLKSVEAPQFHDESFSDREYGRLIPRRREPVARGDTGAKQVDSGLEEPSSGTEKAHLTSEQVDDGGIEEPRSGTAGEHSASEMALKAGYDSEEFDPKKTIENNRLDVTVVDIKMPFMSMVSFMVKWTIASIPALIILTVLGAVIAVIWVNSTPAAFVMLAVIGMFAVLMAEFYYGPRD